MARDRIPLIFGITQSVSSQNLALYRLCQLLIYRICIAISVHTSIERMIKMLMEDKISGIDREYVNMKPDFASLGLLAS
jgi:hypothetical protein